MVPRAPLRGLGPAPPLISPLRRLGEVLPAGPQSGAGDGEGEEEMGAGRQERLEDSEQGAANWDSQLLAHEEMGW